MMRAIGWVLLAALGACSEPAENVPTVENGVAGNDVAEVAAVADNAATENVAAPAVEGIPVALHGRWGMVPADCEAGRADAKGLLTITGEGLRFYESSGRIARVNSEDATRIDAQFAMTGEGMSWTRRMTLAAESDGTALVRQEYGEDAMTGPQRYAKCPA